MDELDIYRRNLERDDELRIKRKLKTINKEKHAENLFNALREIKQSELATELERAENAIKTFEDQIKNCNF
jgi:hypothetical protein